MNLSLQPLQTEVVDLFYLHRWDKKVPIAHDVAGHGRPDARRLGWRYPVSTYVESSLIKLTGAATVRSGAQALAWPPRRPRLMSGEPTFIVGSRPNADVEITRPTVPFRLRAVGGKAVT
jgi:hypothetical protein